MRRKPRILVAVNTLTSVQSGPYTDHMLFYYGLGRYQHKFEFHQMMGKRLSIDRFRNQAASIAIQTECEYLLFIDDDMHLAPDVFSKLIKANLDIAMAHVYIRGYPFKLMAYKKKYDEMRPKVVVGMENLSQEDLTTMDRGDGVILCDAIGTAVSLIKVKALKRTPPAWFVTGTHNTEDIYFCCKAREYYPRTTIGMVKDAITGHVLEPEVINYYTRSALMKFNESFMTAEQIEQVHNEGKDHGVSYIEANLESDDPATPVGADAAPRS